MKAEYKFRAEWKPGMLAEDGAWALIMAKRDDLPRTAWFNADDRTWMTLEGSCYKADEVEWHPLPEHRRLLKDAFWFSTHE